MDIQKPQKVLRDDPIKMKSRGMSRGIMKPLESNPRLAGYQDILRPPQEPQREYILNGCTYGDLYRMASGLHGLPQRGENATICICTEDRGLLMAALLSALSGGPRVVLPYALSPRALAEVHRIPAGFIPLDGWLRRRRTPAGGGNRDLFGTIQGLHFSTGASGL